MPFEHLDQAIAIAETLGEVIGMDVANEKAKDPRFCINLEISKGWVTSIDLESEEGILPSQRIMVNYDKLPIRCRVCLSWKHKASDCEEFKRKHVLGRGRPAFTRNIQNQEKRKNIVIDEDGFQQVINKKKNRSEGISLMHAMPVKAPSSGRGPNRESSGHRSRSPKSGGCAARRRSRGRQPSGKECCRENKGGSYGA